MKKITKRQVTIEPFLRSNYSNKAGQQPVKIRITHNRKSRYYPVHLEGKNLLLSPEQWGNLQQKDVRRKNKEVVSAIADTEAKAREAIKTCTDHDRPFTFEQFEKEFLNNSSSKGFISLFNHCEQELLKENRTGTYHAYKSAFQAFKNYRENREIDPVDVTPELLKDFESYLKRERIVVTATGKTVIRTAGKNTIAIYMRTLKVIYNIAISQNPSLASSYPFARKQNDKGKYKIKIGSGKKGNALTAEELQTLVKTNPEIGSPEWVAKLFWLFSFYCQGMNFKDIAFLKNSDINYECISYIRRKTRDTELIESPITIPITKTMLNIIESLKDNSKHPDEFIFNIVNRTMEPKRQDDVIRQKIKVTNKWLKRICEKVGLPIITTYWARHTYASLLKSSGESVELIRELLGHSDIRTTETYLKRFDIDKKRKANEKIFDTITHL